MIWLVIVYLIISYSIIRATGDDIGRELQENDLPVWIVVVFGLMWPFGLIWMVVEHFVYKEDGL